MLDLLKSLGQKDEIIKESSKEYDNKKVQEELGRYKSLALEDNNSFFKENAQFPLGKGVSSITANPTGLDRTQGKTYPPVPSLPLQPEEALEIAIKRTIKSGAPVNNASFYEECNWHLMNLGFPAKAAIDIKTAIGNLIDKK